jgi:peptide methionine sulfoxide reductase msrA/msrB
MRRVQAAGRDKCLTGFDWVSHFDDTKTQLSLARKGVQRVSSETLRGLMNRNWKQLLVLIAVVAAVGWSLLPFGTTSDKPPAQAAERVDLSGLSVATLAGGCFWCVEAAFEKVPGVKLVVSGYSGGDIANPTYKQVSGGKTKHTEVVQIHYDPAVISYAGLLQVLWRTADPTDSDGQYYDRGSQYRPAIFYHTKAQREVALRARDELERTGPFKKPITIEISPFKSFYRAEEYHQDYYKKNPIHYRLYTIGSGRIEFHEETWGDKLEIDFSKNRGSEANADTKEPATGM